VRIRKWCGRLPVSCDIGGEPLNLNSENTGETQRTLGRKMHTSQNIQEENGLEWNKSNIHLTFRGPYIVIYSHNKTNEMH
jgi:hypothetical protein